MVHLQLGRHGGGVMFLYALVCVAVLGGHYELWAQAQTITGCGPLVPSDSAPFDPPRFSDYQVVATFGRPPAPVDEKSDPRVRRFRTVLRQGATHGPNFAGHFTIVGWGCGASCLQFAIVDVISGRVSFPIGIESVSTTHVGNDVGEVDIAFNALRFRIDSNLLIVLGAINENDSSEGIRYYSWNETTLVPVRTILSRKQMC
jgi:hypothetical protein